MHGIRAVPEGSPVVVRALDGGHLAAQRPKSCRCATCRFTASVARIQKKLSRYDRAVIEKLLSKWAHANTDAVYYRMKLEGKWPQP